MIKPVTKQKQAATDEGLAGWRANPGQAARGRPHAGDRGGACQNAPRFAGRTLGRLLDRTAGMAWRRPYSPGATSALAVNVDIWRIPLETNGAVRPAPLEKVTDDAAVDQMMNGTRDGTVIV